MAVVRCGRGYISTPSLREGDSEDRQAYALGTIRNISVSPNSYQLSQLGGGKGQVETYSVSIELAALPTATEAIINSNRVELLWLEYILDANHSNGGYYKITQLYDVVFQPISKSAVAKNAGETTATTISLSGIAFPDEYDDFMNEIIESNESNAITMIDALARGDL